MDKALVMPLIQEHFDHPNGIPAPIMKKIKHVLGIVDIPKPLPKPNKSESEGRCELCLDAIRGKLGFKKIRY